MTTPTFTDPPVAPSRNAPSTFRERMDAFLAWIVVAWGELTAFVTWAAATATQIALDRTEAAASELAAALSMEGASDFADEAQGFRDDAQAYAATALNAPGTLATCDDSFSVPALGASITKTLDQTGKAYSVGQVQRWASRADPENRFALLLTAFNAGSGALTGTVIGTRGSGTNADWNVSLGPDPLLDRVSQADAEAGTGDLYSTGAMDAERTAQAIEAQVASAAAMSFGDGSDGDVTVTGAVTLTRDMFYRTLTLSGAAAINTAGYRIFVQDLGDLDLAPAGAIYNDGAAGSAGGGGAPGVTVGAGAAAGSSGENGGASGASGAGGAGNGGGGVGSSAGLAVTAYPMRLASPRLSRSDIDDTLAKGGSGGRAGGAGGSSTVPQAGGAGGTGGGGAGVVALFARRLSRAGTTAAAAIRARGGAGNVGGAGVNPSTGGGGGGSGAGGGEVVLVYQQLLGSTAADMIDVSGGDGGGGGNGAPGSEGGDGGASGEGGRLTVIDLTAATITHSTGSASVAGTANASATGGAGGVAVVDRFDF